jgi:hypothetical protein
MGRFQHCPEEYSDSIEGFCHVGRNGMPPQFIVWGDSFGNSLLEGIDQRADAEGIAGVFIGTHACPPLIGYPGLFPPTMPRCAALQKKTMEALDSGRIKNVIVVAAWGLYDSINRSLFDSSVAPTFEWLKQHGVTTTIIGSIPIAAANVRLSMAKAEAFGTQADLGIDSTRRNLMNRIDQLLERPPMQTASLF